MNKHKILIDFTILDQNSGIGFLNHIYANLLIQKQIDNFEYTFLVPNDKVGQYGNSVKYLTPARWRKKFPILNKKYDLWHSTYQLSKFKPSPLTKNVILTIHDLNFLYERDPLHAKKDLRRLQRKVNSATIITCISNFVVEEVKKNLKTKGKTIKMIYNGVKDLSSQEGCKPNFVDDKPFLFALGEIVEKKNFGVLLELMKLIPEYNLYICGINDRPYADAISEKIKFMNLPNVFLPGIISEENKIWLYKNCIAFVHPSKLEGFGLPVIEAMSFGKPVFLSKFTSLPEIGGNHAFYFNDFEPETMAETIKNGISEYNTNPDMKNNIKNWAKQFDYIVMTENYINLYLETLK